MSTRLHLLILKYDSKEEGIQTKKIVMFVLCRRRKITLTLVFCICEHNPIGFSCSALSPGATFLLVCSRVLMKIQIQIQIQNKSSTNTKSIFWTVTDWNFVWVLFCYTTPVKLIPLLSLFRKGTKKIFWSLAIWGCTWESTVLQCLERQDCSSWQIPVRESIDKKKSCFYGPFPSPP